MKERPILFSTEMVNAIFDGRKTQTRRIVDSSCTMERPAGFKDAICKLVDGHAEWSWPDFPEFPTIKVRCRYGEIEDVLWVRETWCRTVVEDEAEPGFLYKAEEDPTGKFPHFKWKPSIHMSKKACRLRLQLVGKRIERLNEITEEDALKEGIQTFTKDNKLWKFGVDGWGWTDMRVDAKTAYLNLWSKINGDESTDSNPWVWVLDFKKIN